MEQEKRGRGRPKIDVGAAGFGASSRRQAVNAMYMFEGVHFISEAAAEIPDGDLLWYSDDATQTAKSKNGILEQLGRMVLQDHFSGVDCIYVANLAIAALKNGSTSREIEKAIREIRLMTKKSVAEPDNAGLTLHAGQAVMELQRMGGSCNEHP